MERRDQQQDDLYYQLALALLGLIDHPVVLNLKTQDPTERLVLTGTLMRAFDTPGHPSITLAIGAQTATIRIGHLKRIVVKPKTKNPKTANGIRLQLADGFELLLTHNDNAPKAPRPR